MLFDPAVHERLVESPWDDGRVHDAVAAIVADAESAFDEATLTWPVHEEDGEDAAGWRTIYLGGGGVVWALHRLGSGRDWAPVAQALVRQYAAEPDFGEPHASLWMGESGLLLVEEVVAGGADLDRLATLVGANAENEARETMWGAPGTMLAAQFLHARTGEPRWSRLWDESADSLLAAREPDGFWLQRLYGHEVHYVGPVHGFAGNILALRWRRDVDREAVAAATRIAQREDGLAQWPPALEPPSRRQSVRTQFCHGAPGMVAALAAVAPDDEEWTRLLVEGGELTWQARAARKRAWALPRDGRQRLRVPEAARADGRRAVAPTGEGVRHALRRTGRAVAHPPRAGPLHAVDGRRRHRPLPARLPRARRVPAVPRAVLTE